MYWVGYFTRSAAISSHGWKIEPQPSLKAVCLSPKNRWRKSLLDNLMEILEAGLARDPAIRKEFFPK